MATCLQAALFAGNTGLQARLLALDCSLYCRDFACYCVGTMKIIIDKDRARAHELALDRGLYLLSNGHLLKIGLAKSIHRRRLALQSASGMEIVLLASRPMPLSIYPLDNWHKEAKMLEKRLHELFADLRQHGEWFLPAKKLFSYFKQNSPPWLVESAFYTAAI